MRFPKIVRDILGAIADSLQIRDSIPAVATGFAMTTVLVGILAGIGTAFIVLVLIIALRWFLRNRSKLLKTEVNASPLDNDGLEQTLTDYVYRKQKMAVKVETENLESNVIFAFHAIDDHLGNYLVTATPETIGIGINMHITYEGLPYSEILNEQQANLVLHKLHLKLAELGVQYTAKSLESIHLWITTPRDKDFQESIFGENLFHIRRFTGVVKEFLSIELQSIVDKTKGSIV